ncbi:unnamed protein product [Symbiodinium pilosum]|uniref:Prolyl 4-hydroxylase alpha subunit Fe(2+) 2OG dioxygenase domain-containing protein n=1 Tax=Symbiodinium pilosum TaxID=2952 RepID=A0A812KAB5_SYMPI|nr:unnamed protein product [Symbiodinium pilosum]
MEAARRWLNDDAAIQLWNENHPERNLPELLKTGGGFAKIPGFLPENVAEAVCASLHALDSWERAGEGGCDDLEYTDRVRHRFWIADVETDDILLGASRVLARLLPDTLPNFSAARYEGNDHIAAHDDLVPEAYTTEEICEVRKAFGSDDLQSAVAAWKNKRRASQQLEDALATQDLAAVRQAAAAAAKASEVVQYRRWVAAAYYLNKDWQPSFGGHFTDLADPSLPVRHLPEFNTLVVFEVPRLHSVEAVHGLHARYSLFGWWLLEDTPKRRRKVMRKPSSSIISSRKRKTSQQTLT